MILVIDNYDSFVYNLVQYFGELKQEIRVFRNDKITVNDIRKIKPSHIVISPGPGIPENAGISLELISSFAGKIHILGVCLGHQAIAVAFGGTIIRAKNVVHGKVTKIYHDGRTIYQGIRSPFIATRYHSLIVQRENLPECLEISAWTADGLVMGIRHKIFIIEGVQFHPESVLTKTGKKILKNFIKKKACP